MLRNYFKTAWRNLWKNKTFSLINVIGLAIGMAACIIIMLFVLYESSFDGIHKKNIYRLNEVQKFEGMVASQKVALSMFPMGPTMKAEFPEIKNYTRINWMDKVQMTYGAKRIFLPQMFFVDSTFLQIFDFKLLRGDRATALQKPNSAVLTASSAEKLFGHEDPLGKTVTHYGEDTLNFTVTAVLQDPPGNSQLQFDGLFSFNTIYKPDWMNGWGGNWLDTYFELAPNANVSDLEKKFPAYLKKYLAKNDNWKHYELFLLPLKEVHANAADIGLDYINYQKFDRKYTNIFSIIGLIVLIIACVNFMNLSTARSAERAREVGIRKSIGASRWQLAGQFIGESVMISVLALLIALIFVKLSLHYVNALSQRDLHFPSCKTAELIYIILATILVGFLSGLYPAAYLSSFQPVKVLKGSVQTGRNKGLLRNILVVAQFTSAIFLIIATIFAVRQLQYMQNRDTGFNRDQVFNIPLDGVTSRKFSVLKQDILNSSLVSSVTGAQDLLGSHLDQSGIEFQGDGPLRQLTSTRLIVDPDYLDLYKIPIVGGKNFSKDQTGNGKEYIINESLARELLRDHPKLPLASVIGKNFGFRINDSLGTIVGIARDFNFNSLHYKIETMFLFNQSQWGYSEMSVKINGNKPKEAIAFVEAAWKKEFPDHPFEYQFLDDHFTELYLADTQVSKFVATLAGLSIVISCLGLFGLASFSAEKRIKEVGIRRVMGATVQSVVSLLSKDFLRLVLIANLVAWPIAWFAVNKWLLDFAFRINISWWVFVMSGIAAMLIALVTVSFQAIKAAVANPVESLRTE